VVSHPGAEMAARATGEATRMRESSSAPAIRPIDLAVPIAREVRPAIKHLPLLILGAGILAVNLAGFHYYALPLAERVRDPAHAWFRPTGLVGQSAGVIGFVMFLFLYLYPLRKRVRALAFLGGLSRWLDVHIVAGLTVPLIVAIHAGWRFDGLIGLGYAAMFLVSLSGIVGKYLYIRIPRGKSGLELTLAQIERERTDLTRRIAEETGLDPEEVSRDLSGRVGTEVPEGIARAFIRLLVCDFARWHAVGQLRRKWNRVGKDRGLDRAAVRNALRLARRQIAIAQRVRMLEATQRVFRFWHVAHRPLSVTAFAVVAIHVGVAVTLGVTWFW